MTMPKVVGPPQPLNAFKNQPKTTRAVKITKKKDPNQTSVMKTLGPASKKSKSGVDLCETQGHKLEMQQLLVVH